ncbi:MAG: hypothetical protein BRC25_01495, partial [Parcubacteria group bacterium SW_6_46_9]
MTQSTIIMTRSTNLLPGVYNLLFAFAVSCGFIALLLTGSITANAQAVNPIDGASVNLDVNNDEYSATIDTTNLQNIKLSFDYDASELDEGDGDVDINYSAGNESGTETVTGKTNDSNPSESGSVTLSGVKAKSSLNVSISADTSDFSSPDSDYIALSNITVSGDKKEIEETKRCGEGDKNPEGDLDVTNFDPTAGEVSVENTSESNCSYDVGLAAYKGFAKNGSGMVKIKDPDGQKLHNSATTTLAAGENTVLSVEAPGCAYQIDAFYGDLIEDFDEEGLYKDRKLDIDGYKNDQAYSHENLDSLCTKDNGENTGSIEITKYSCAPSTSVSRDDNGPAGSSPDDCSPAGSGVTFGYNFTDDSNEFVSTTTTNADSVATFSGLNPKDSPHQLSELNDSGDRKSDKDILGFYCEGDDGEGTDNEEHAYVTNDDTTNCVVYNENEPEPVACPFEEGQKEEEYDSVITFSDDGLRSDQSTASAETSQEALALNAGEYEVSMFGFDDKRGSNEYDRSNQNQQNEQYFTRFSHQNGYATATVSTDDLPDNTQFGTTTKTTTLTLASSTDTIQARHSAFFDQSVDNNSANSLTAGCVGVDKQEEPETSQCVTPQTKNDTDTETVTKGNNDFEKLWDVFAAEKQQGDSDFAQVDTKSEVNDNQTQIQFFEALKDSTEVTVTYIRHEDEHQKAGNSNVVGWYEKGATSTFTPLFEHKDHSGYSATSGTDDATKTFTAGEDFGFAIKSETADQSDQYSVYSENDLNSGGQDRVVVYRLDTDKYALGFEDLYDDNDSDTDFEDMTILVEITGCNDEKPDQDTATLRVCKLLTDDGELAAGDEGTTFSLDVSGVDGGNDFSTTTEFSLPLDYTGDDGTDLIDDTGFGEGSNDAVCKEYTVSPGDYGYSEETDNNDPELLGFKAPQYNDGIEAEGVPGGLNDFSEFSSGTDKSDGKVTDLGENQTRTIVVKNRVGGEVRGDKPLSCETDTLYHLKSGSDFSTLVSIADDGSQTELGQYQPTFDN